MGASDENLRLVAEVVDKFSTPLKNLRAMLQGINSPPGVDKMRQGFEGTQKAAGALGREVSNTLTPALNAAGIAGLSISGALLGVGAALRSFSSSTATLSLLGRETGMTVNAMRTLEEVGKRFNLAPESMQQSFRTFSENAQELRKGVGEITGFLQSQSPAVSRWAADLQRDLKAGLDPDVAYRRALEFMRRIQDPIDRGRFAEKLFGSKQFGVLGSEDLGGIFKDVEAKIGKVPKSAEESALRFNRAMDDIRSSLIGMRDGLGAELMTTLADLGKEFSAFVDRPAVKEGVRTAIKDISDALKRIDWKETGTAIGTVMSALGTAFTDAARGLNHLSEAMRAFQDGRYLDMLKALDGQKVDRFSELPKLERKRSVLEQTIEALDKAPRDRTGARGMTEQEYQSQRGKLGDELHALTNEIEKLRKQQQDENQKATIQKQSFDSSASFGGAMIQNAALGGMVASGYAARGLSSPWGGEGRFPALRQPSEGMRRTRQALTGEGSVLTHDPMLDLIMKAEGTSRDGFNTTLDHGRWTGGKRNLVGMTLDQIDELQTQMLANPENRRLYGGGRGSSALGAFQIVRSTLRNLRKQLGLNGSEMFDEALQRRLGTVLLRGRGRDVAGLRNEWEGLRRVPGERILEAWDRRERMAREGTLGRPPAASSGGEAFNGRMQALKKMGPDDFGLPGVGSSTDLLRQALRTPLLSGPSVDLRGGANLDITLKGFPTGTSTNSSSEGILREMNVRRQSAIPRAGVDI